jgi:PIN domain nuclease of toxin-antitoxin system
MRLLLDTHMLLWALADDRRLPQPARKLIEDTDNEVWVSAVSVWEVSIKHSLWRGDMPISGAQALRYCQDAGYSMLAILPAHAAAVEALPALHADPFDRMLVAQALHEPLRLLTHDEVLARYSDSVICA